MSTGAPTNHAGYFHQAAVYGSDEERHDMVAALIGGAMDEGQPVLAALPPEAWVRSAVGDATNVTLLPPLTASSRPATTIKTLTELLEPLAAEGYERIRVVQAVPHPGTGSPWEGWCRYEAAVNHLLADHPLWGLCLYDARSASAEVLSDVERTHPHFLTLDGDRPNDRYVEPDAFLESRHLSRPDPLERSPAALELIDPVPADSRRAVRDRARHTELGADDVDRLVLATSEAVTNAMVHGQPPVVLRIWTAPRRMVVTITDRGVGPADPYVGLRPQRSHGEGGGLGLWIVHQLVDVNFGRTNDGFTLRLTA